VTSHSPAHVSLIAFALIIHLQAATTMEVLSGVASASQLLAYAHSTFQVIVRLYKQLKTGPAALKQQQSSVRILLSIVDSLQKRPPPADILTTLLELSTLATEALNLITRSQKTGFLGLQWAAFRYESALLDVFASLKDKREILHLAISIDTRRTSARLLDCAEDMAEPPKNGLKKKLQEIKGRLPVSSIPHHCHSDPTNNGQKKFSTVYTHDSGNDNDTMVGNGPVGDDGVRRTKVITSGERGRVYAGNDGEYNHKKHGGFYRSLHRQEKEEPPHEAEQPQFSSVQSDMSQAGSYRFGSSLSGSGSSPFGSLQSDSSQFAPPNSNPRLLEAGEHTEPPPLRQPCDQYYAGRTGNRVQVRSSPTSFPAPHSYREEGYASSRRRN